jgi:hypothetical protein
MCKKSMKNIYTLIGFLVCLSISGVTNAFEFSIGKRFLDYGNGAINLDNVHRISPELIVHTGFYYPDDKETIFEEDEYQLSELEDLSLLFDPMMFSDEPFVFIDLKASLFFDLFQLLIIQQALLKLPTNQEQIDLAFEYAGDEFIAFLDKLEHYLVAEEFLEWDPDGENLKDFGARYFQVVEEIDELNIQSVKRVQQDLLEFQNYYLQAVN